MNHELAYYLEKYKKRIILWTLLIVSLIGFIVFASVQQQLENQRGKIAVDVLTAPQDAQVSLENGETIQQGTAYIKPGKHTVTVSKEGFKSYTLELNAVPENYPTIYVGLIPDNAETRKWREKNQAIYNELELRTRERSKKFAVEFNKNNPIIKDLPVKDPYFTISYKNVDDKNIALIISGTSPRYRQYAIEKIYQMGYDPTDYKIEIKKFENPLGVTQ